MKQHWNSFTTFIQNFRNAVYAIRKLEIILLDLDSILLETYDNPEGESFHFHDQSHGCHQLISYDGIIGDLLKIQLRDGANYSSTDIENFLQLLLDELQNDYTHIPLLLREDSGFTK